MPSPYNPKMGQGDLVIYDSTLREGEQAPGVTFSVEEKLEIARALDKTGIPQMDAGFPAVSQGEKEAVKAVCDQGLKADVLALARANPADIDQVLESGADGVIVFIATSPIHLKEKLGMPFNEAREMAISAVEYAKDHGLFTALSAEDGTRTGYTALLNLFMEAEVAGADRVHISDTAGCILPEAIADLVRELVKEVDVPLGVHCHDDFGLALANSLAAVKAGAMAVSATVNGMGERAGNCPTEELVMALKVLYGMDLGFRTEELTELSALVERLSGVRKSPTKAIVGENVFAHESGIHVSAVLKNPFTYEPFLPEVVGQRRKIVLGKHSGRAAVRAHLEEMGIEAMEGEITRILEAVKEAAQGGERIDDAVFRRLVKGVMRGK
jgi:methanogen homocitrate synthase